MGAAFIGETIQSVLDQSLANFEIIVVDDCSTDETKDEVLRFDDQRIRYYRNELNLGPEGNWNRCRELINGKYYKLLPHDDLLLPECLHDQVSVLEQDIEENLALVFSSKRVITDSGKKLLDRHPLGSKDLAVSAKDLIRKCIRSGSNVIGEPGSGLVRSSVLERVGKYDISFPYVIDLDFWFRVLEHGDAMYLAKVATCFRVSDQAWTAKIGKRQYSDYINLVDRYFREPLWGISKHDRLLGIARCYMMTLARRVVYTATKAFKLGS